MNKKAAKDDTSWGEVADWYDGLLETSPDSYQAQVILPNLLRIVDPKVGATILDVACGQGYFSRALAEKGASVVGCDISTELIGLARKDPIANTRFEVAPANELSFASDGSFDAALIVLALQNIEDMPGTMNECARVLRPGARLIVVLNHPAFRIPKRSSWQWDDPAGAQFRRIDSYMSESRSEIDMTPGETDKSAKRSTVSFHRPLQVYFKALSKAGFSVIRLEEWISHKRSQPGPRAAEEDRIRKEIPMFLMLEAVKR